MKQKFIAFLLAPLLILGLFGSPSPSAEAAVDNWQKAMTIDPRWTTDFGSETFKESVRKMREANVEMLTLTMPIYQSNIYSTEIYPGWNTPTDESLIAGVQFARSLGFRVTLKVHMVSHDGQWRAHINPSNRAGWFRSYGHWVERYARIAEANGVEMFVIGSELIDMATVHTNSTNTQHWKDLIARVRGVYSGKLTYSANWGGSWWADEKNRIEFWSDLDYIGIAAYFVLNSEPNAEALKGQWDYWRTTDIQPLRDRWGKPVIFTEIGYRSMNGARFQPFNSWDHWGVNEWEQAQLYEALFSYWNNHPWFMGVHLWDWMSDPNAGGPHNDGYTPQGKSAEGVMRAWFGSAAPAPGPEPENPSFSAANASAYPENPAVGQETLLGARVSAGRAPSSRIIVDVEVEDSFGTKVFQQFFENQSFAANETKTYAVGWTPASEGVYRVRIGVFNSTWSVNYLWVGNAATMHVRGAPPAPTSTPPAPGGVEIWWPTDGSTISGIQPFRAMLSNWRVGDYDMFWQVDGDRLNPMETSLDDYPHKAAWVDVSGWTWNAEGAYVLNFLAKDRAGVTLGERQSTIRVAR